MRRVLCVWFPSWPIQRLRSAKPQLRQRPLVVFADAGGRGLRVTACSAEAAQQGVQPGRPLAEARALLERPTRRRSRAILPAAWERSNPAADRQVLQQLAFHCQRYTPLVGLAECDAPESLLLDIAGCDHLYGDERGLVTAVTRDLTSQGFEIRTGLADTIGTAWAVAHAGTSGQIVPPGDPTAVLQPLPLAALRVAPDTIGTLGRLDIRTVAQLLALPRASLPSRFGRALVRRLDQALGIVPESFTPERFAEPVSAAWSADDPLTSQLALTYVFRQLLSELLVSLATHRAGILELACELRTEQQTIPLALRMSRPTTDEQHLIQLFELRCERQAWPGGIFALRLEVQRAAWIGAHQATLFAEDTQDTARDVALLVERLSSRLGEQAVLRPVYHPEPLPELSCRWEPWLTGATDRDGDAASPNPLVMQSRPWRLLPTPQPVEATSVVPDGPPLRLFFPGETCQVAQAWGPERIESGWSHQRDVQRDYYRVETERGAHLWVFRQRDTGQWFLHGIFE
ncbi:MAG TPA: DNA polymerase Y family protein [Planctomycetaceae bacterium]|nr:DNA polymerase Y family protein [Planctomycetaceae bacterium]